MAHRTRTPEEHTHRAHQMLKGAGYKVGGQVKSSIVSAIRQHENAEHGGKHEPIKLARGGAAKGVKEVNIEISTGSSPTERQALVQRGIQAGARLGAMMPRPAPGGPPPGAGAMPPGGSMMPPRPGMPPGAPMMADGGAIKVKGHYRTRPRREHE